MSSNEVGCDGGPELADATRVQSLWDPQKDWLTLSRHNWGQHVAKVKEARVVSPRLETSHAAFEVLLLREVYLSQLSSLALLEGASLVQIFDGSLLCTSAAHRTIRPFMLVASEIPSLVCEAPNITKIAVARMLSLRNEQAPLAEVRAELFKTVVRTGAFVPGVP